MILPTLSLNVEKWKFNAEYQIYVSNMGNFKDKEKRNLPKKIWNGYHAVYTCVGYRPCHRLVARTWIPTPDMENLTVDHKDSNRRNNMVSNLEWVSRDENENRARDNELKKSDIAANTLHHYEPVKNLTKSEPDIKTEPVASMTLAMTTTNHLNYSEKVTYYNEINNCGYTYTKSGITFTFKDMNEAVYFVRIMLGANGKAKAIAGMINDASAQNKNYYGGKWGRIDNE